MHMHVRIFGYMFIYVYICINIRCFCNLVNVIEYTKINVYTSIMRTRRSANSKQDRQKKILVRILYDVHY